MGNFRDIRIVLVALTMFFLSACSQSGDPISTVNLGIKISPRNASIDQGGTQLFTTTGGTKSYTYMVDAADGTITANGLYVNSTGKTGSVVIRVKDSAGNSDSATVTVGSYDNYLLGLPGLAGMWRMTDPNWDIDETGNYTTNTISIPISAAVDQPISVVQDPTNTAADFSGGGYVTITNTPGFDPAGDYTVMAWIKTASLGAPPMVAVSQADSTTPGNDTAYIAVRSDSTDTIGCLYYDTVTAGLEWIDSGVYATPGQWYHAALVKSGTTVSLYVDGILKGQSTTASFNASPGTDLAIGAQVASGPTYSNYFNGSIDEVMLFTSALTAAEVSDYVLKTLGKTLILSPDTLTMAIRGDQAFTVAGGIAPYTYTVTAGAGTISATGKYENTSTAPETVTVRATDSQGRTADATINVVWYSTIISSSLGLEGFWRLESTVSAVDETGHYATNTISMPPLTAAGTTPIASTQDAANQAIAFDGMTDYITIDNTGRLFNPTSTDFTIMAWINPATIDWIEPFVAFSQADPALGRETAYIAIRTDSTDTIGCWYYDTVALSRIWIDSGVYAAANTWHHAALVKSGTTASFYVDGILTKTATMNLGTTTGNMAIGGMIDSNPAVTRLFNGSIDEVITYTRALSASDIATYFKATQGTHLILYPRDIKMAQNSEQVFKTTGGTAPYTYSMAGSGTINSATGFYKNASTAFPETVTINVTDAAGHTDSTTVTVIPYSESVGNVSMLLGYWPLENGSVPADKTTQHADGTEIGTITTPPGAIQVDPTSTAGHFDGSSSLVIDNVPAFDPSATDFTVEAWLRVTDETAFATVAPIARVAFSQTDGAGVNDIAYIGINSSGTHTIGSWIGGSWIDSGVVVVPGANNWYHVTVTKSGNEVRVYVNGDLKITTGGVTVPAAVYSSLMIGAMIVNNTPTVIDYFLGDIDDVALYGRALSDSEIQKRYLDSRGLKVGLSPAAMINYYNGTTNFQGFAGSGPGTYTYSIVPTGPVDGTVDFSTGIYTAPDYAAAAYEVDTVRVTDADGYTATAPVISLFLPNQIGGLIQWLNAGFITGTADGDAVVTWPDASLNGNFAEQLITPSERPLFRTNVINGKPALHFDGARSMFSKTGFSDLFNGDDKDYTFIIVFRTENTVLTQSLYCIGDTTNTHIRPGMINSGFYRADRRNGPNVFVDSGSTITASTWSFAAQRFWGTGTGMTSLYFNHATFTAFAADPADAAFETNAFSFASNEVRIGARTYASDQYLDGYIAEIIVYNNDIGEPALQRVQEYLRNKYDLWP